MPKREQLHRALRRATDSTYVSYFTVNGCYSYHPTYEVILRARAYSPTLPAVYLEGVYENHTTGFPGTPLDLRKLVGWTMTSVGSPELAAAIRSSSTSCCGARVSSSP